MDSCGRVGHQTKGPATRNDFVNDIVNDARADAIFATLKAIVDDEKSTSSTISLRVAWPLERLVYAHLCRSYPRSGSIAMTAFLHASRF